MAGWILSVFSGRCRDLMVPLFKSLVRSRTEFCCPLWHPTKIDDIKKLESVQRAYTAKIEEVRHLPYWERLAALGLMSLQRRRERYIVIHIFKILHDMAPNDLNMEFYESNRRGNICKLPPLVRNAKAKYQTKYDQSFRVLGAKLWNLLPKQVKVKKSLDSFKTAVTTFITQFPDRPPVPGITSDNSLLTLLVPGRSTWCTPIRYGGLAASDDSDEDSVHADGSSDEESDEDIFQMAR